MKAWNYLSSGWSNFSLPSNIQKRLYKFLLRRAIGQFLANELDLENFDIELVNGSVELRDLALNLQALNDCIANTPFILEEGHVASISASLPWSNFWSGDISLKVHGLRLTLRSAKDRPKKQAYPTDEEESPIMSSSLHFADDFLRTEMEPDQNQELYESIQQSLHDLEGDSTPASPVDVGSEGLQVLTRVIDKMLAKVKVDVADTLVRIVHKSAVSLTADHRGSDNDYSLDIHLPRISYFDETPEFNSGQSPPSNTAAAMADSSVLLAPAANETIKIIALTSPTIWIRTYDTSRPLYDMSPRNEPMSHDTPVDQNKEDGDQDSHDTADDSLSQTEFYEAEEGTSSMFYSSIHSSHMSGSTTPRAFPTRDAPSSSSIPRKPYAALLATTMDKENWMRLKLHSSSPFDTDSPNPIQSSAMKQLDFLVTHIRVMTTPRQIAFLLDLLQNITGDTASSIPKNTTNSKQTGSAQVAHTASPLNTHMRHLARESSSNRLQPPTAPSPALSSPSTLPHKGTAAQPVSKIKLQVSRLEAFFLYDDTSTPPDGSWTNVGPNLAKNSSHLKLSIDQVIVRLQQFPHSADDMKDPRRSRSNRPSRGEAGPMAGAAYSSHSLPRMEASHTPTSAHNPYSLPSNAMPSKTLDVRISNIALSEWVARPPGLSRRLETGDLPLMGMTYDTYIPVLSFDERIKRDYDDAIEFPMISTLEASAAHRARVDAVDAVRIRVETKRVMSRDGSNRASFEEDISADVQALRLQIDVRIVDRLEKYILAMLDKKETTANPEFRPSTSDEPDHFAGQNVYDDLDRLSIEHRNHSKARARFAFIRIILLVPDMSQANSNDSSDCVRDEVLSVDLKKMVVNWDGNSNNNNSFHGGRESKESGSTPSMPYPTMPSSPSPTSGRETTIINADVQCIHVFLKPAKERASHCWFTAKTVVPKPESDRLFKADAQSPTVEITIRSPKSTFVSSSRAGFFGSGSDIPSNLFEHLYRNESFESNQKLHVPMEDQAESAMMFKQRTVETALFVANCHLPETRMRLSKETWDTVQMIQGDLLLWQPRFLAQLPAKQPQEEPTLPTRTGSMNDIFSDATHNQYFDAPCASPTKTSSILSQSHERLGSCTQVPSLFAVVAVLSDSIWDLQYTDSGALQNTYRLHMNEFRYFAAMKHLGQNENITTLDIDDLSLDDMSLAHARVPLLYKTLPKNIKPKRNTAMVSLFSRLIMAPELNKQRKETSIVACNICWRFTPDVSFLENLIQFQKLPEMPHVTPPVQDVKVYAHVLDLSIDYKPIHIPSRGALVIDDLQVITELLAGAPVVVVKTFVQAVDLFLIDDASEMTQDRVDQLENKVMDARRYWTALGLACVLYLRNLEAHVKVKSNEADAPPTVEVSLLNNTLKLECCADSFQSLVNFITYAVNDGDGVLKQAQEKSSGPMPQAEPTKRRRSNVSIFTTHKEDMLASVDEDAFRLRRQSPDMMASRQGTFQSSMPLAAPELGFVESYYSRSHIHTNEESSSIRPPKPRRRKAEKAADAVVRLLVPDMEELEIKDDFYNVNEKVEDTYQSTVDTSRSIFSVRIRDCDVCWNMHDGCDWAYTRASFQGARPSPQPTRSMSSFGSADMSRTSSVDTALGRSPHDPSQFLAQSPTFSLSDYGASQPSDLDDYSTSASPRIESPYEKKVSSFAAGRQKNRQRLRRSHHPQMEIKFENICMNLDLMPPGDSQRFHLWLAIRDIEMIDNIKTSTWKTFLGYMRPDASSYPRERGSSMVNIELTAVRPIQDDPTQEFLLRVHLLPIRLYVDQDALNFLVQYFAFDKSILRSTEATNAAIPRTAADPENDEPLFFQHVDIQPIALKVDYKPKYINYGNIKEGQLSELVNLFHLDGAEMTLSHVKLTGVAGLTELADKLGQQWLPHIKNTQVPHMVSGVSPIRSIVNLGTGVADLVLLPIQQYRKDGRIIKGLQRGTQSFARATAVEAIKLSSRVASGTQVILEHADGLLSRPPTHAGSSQGEASIGDTHFVYLADGDPLLQEEDEMERDEECGISGGSGGGGLELRQSNRFAKQPNDLSQGLQHAYHSLSRNFGSAAQTIFAIPTEIKDREGTAKAVIKAVPVAVIKPMIGVTGAFQSILAGLRNTIDPAKRLQNEDKFK